MTISNDPIISVYIVNKNYDKYLRKAIKSVLDQTFKSRELILIDDGSSDKSIEIIESFKKKNLCRAIYNKSSKGLIKSSNIAIKTARGKYVIRLDADDYFDTNALSVLYDKIVKEENVSLVYSDYYLVDSNDNILSLEKQIFRNKQKLNHLPVLAACCLIKKNTLFSVNLYDEKFTRQDGVDMWYKLLNNYKSKHISLPLFYYRKHESNLTKNKSKLYKTRSRILNKFSNFREIQNKVKITCVIPVRGKKVDLNCNSLELFKGQPLIFYTINEALKVKQFRKVIITTSDSNLIKRLINKYKRKIHIYKRKQILSSINMSFKESVIEAINHFEKLKPDVLAILTIENPLRKKHYIEQAISNLLIHKSDLVIGTVPDFQNNYYKFSSNGIKLLSDQKNIRLRLEKNIIHKDVGAFSVMKYSSYVTNDIKKVTNISIDENESFLVNSKTDLENLAKISSRHSK
jgi:glycosyltransferase involved in cell wall biosynthesis